MQYEKWYNEITPFLMLAKEKRYRQTGQNQKDYYPKESNCIWL